MSDLALVVIPFVPEKLRPEVRALGEQVGAEFREMVTPTSYWSMFAELWPGERDFIVWEEDVVASVEMIEEMRHCRESCAAAPSAAGRGMRMECSTPTQAWPWCASGRFGERCPMR